MKPVKSRPLNKATWLSREGRVGGGARSSCAAPRFTPAKTTPPSALNRKAATPALVSGGTAAFPFVCSLRTDAGVTGPFLTKELLARSGDVGPATGIDRAHPAGGQVHENHFVKKLLIDRAAEIGRVDRFLADFFAGGVVNGYGQHGSRSASLSSGRSRPRFRFARHVWKFGKPFGFVSRSRPRPAQTLLVWRMVM